MCTCILSKVLMYNFHYDDIKYEYDNNPTLLFSDTDSLMYEIKTDVYEDFSKDKKCLISAIILLSQNILMIQTN